MGRVQSIDRDADDVLRYLRQKTKFRTFPYKRTLQWMQNDCSSTESNTKLIVGDVHGDPVYASFSRSSKDLSTLRYTYECGGKEESVAWVDLAVVSLHFPFRYLYSTSEESQSHLRVFIKVCFMIEGHLSQMSRASRSRTLKLLGPTLEALEKAIETQNTLHGSAETCSGSQATDELGREHYTTPTRRSVTARARVRLDFSSSPDPLQADNIEHSSEHELIGIDGATRRYTPIYRVPSPIRGSYTSEDTFQAKPAMPDPLVEPTFDREKKRKLQNIVESTPTPPARSDSPSAAEQSAEATTSVLETGELQIHKAVSTGNEGTIRIRDISKFFAPHGEKQAHHHYLRKRQKQEHANESIENTTVSADTSLDNEENLVAVQPHTLDRNSAASLDDQPKWPTVPLLESSRTANTQSKLASSPSVRRLICVAIPQRRSRHVSKFPPDEISDGMLEAVEKPAPPTEEAGQDMINERNGAPISTEHHPAHEIDIQQVHNLVANKANRIGDRQGRDRALAREDINDRPHHSSYGIEEIQGSAAGMPIDRNIEDGAPAQPSRKDIVECEERTEGSLLRSRLLGQPKPSIAHASVIENGRQENVSAVSDATASIAVQSNSVVTHLSGAQHLVDGEQMPAKTSASLSESAGNSNAITTREGPVIHGLPVLGQQEFTIQSRKGPIVGLTRDGLLQAQPYQSPTGLQIAPIGQVPPPPITPSPRHYSHNYPSPRGRDQPASSVQSHPQPDLVKLYLAEAEAHWNAQRQIHQSISLIDKYTSTIKLLDGEIAHLYQRKTFGHQLIGEEFQKIRHATTSTSQYVSRMDTLKRHMTGAQGFELHARLQSAEERRKRMG